MFDLDGTLADTARDIAWSLNRTLAAVAIPPLPEAVILRHVGGGFRALVQNVRKEMAAEDAGVAAQREDEMLDMFRREYGGHLVVETKLYPGVRETLERLDGARRTVVTNKSEEYSRRILDRLGMGRFFEAIAGGDTYPEKKPSPMPLAEHIRRFGAPALMIGDSAVDIQAAKAAGCASCAVTFGYGSTRDDLSGADFRIDRFEELVALCS